jgi:hypothetical protein
MNPQVLHSYGYWLPLHDYIYGGLFGVAALGFVLAVVTALVMSGEKRGFRRHLTGTIVIAGSRQCARVAKRQITSGSMSDELSGSLSQWGM